jgi:hypothetical protein
MDDNYEIDDAENPLLNDKSLQVLRIELNRAKTIFLYYRIYPKKDSLKYPTEKTALFFFFEDNETVTEKFLQMYLSIAGEINRIDFGKYLNKKGCKKKRKLVNFAIVLFNEEGSLNRLMRRTDMQIKINGFIEKKRSGQEVALSYDIGNTKNVDDEGEWQDAGEEDEDEDGFVQVNANRKFCLFN